MPKFDMPVYTENGLQYDMTSRNGCIVFPIFRAMERRDPIEYVNSAFWAAHSFVINSDITERQVPIYFYVEDIVYESLKQLFEDSHIPERCILIREFTPKCWYGSVLSKKLHTVLDDYFKKYENVILLDCDTFLAKADTAPPLNIERLWYRKDYSLFGSYDVGTEAKVKTKVFWGCSDMNDEEEYQAFKGIVRLHLNKEIDFVYGMNGYINAFSPPNIRQDYKDFVEKYIPIFYNDEVLNSIYMQTHNRPIEDIHRTWEIEVACRDEEFSRYMSSDMPFFIHTHVHRLAKPENVQAFRAGIGQKVTS